MALVLVVLAVAGAVGVALGGRLRGLAVRSPGLAVAALLVQLAGALALAPVALAVSALLVALLLLRNRGLRGTGLVALGLLANALVVGANGVMPVSADAALRARVAVPVGDGRHEPADAHTRLRVLADVVPVPLPVAPSVVSAGDLAVAAGLGQLLLVGLLRGRRAPARPRRTAAAV